MKKLYWIVGFVVLMQSFMFSIAITKRPIEDYVGLVLAGIVILIVGEVIQLIIRLIKHLLK